MTARTGGGSMEVSLSTMREGYRDSAASGDDRTVTTSLAPFVHAFS